MSTPPSTSVSHAVIIKAVALTAAVMIVISSFFFYWLRKFRHTRKCYRNKSKGETSFRREAVAATDHEDVKKNVNCNVKGLIVEENGMDVLYVRKLDGSQLRTLFPNVMLNPSFEGDGDEEKRIDATLDKSKCSRTQEIPHLCEPSHIIAFDDVVKTAENLRPSKLPPPLLPPPPLSTPTTNLGEQTQASSHSSSPSPPPPPPPPLPPTPNIPSKKVYAAPPPVQQKASGLVSVLKPPPAPKGLLNSLSQDKTEDTFRKSLRETGSGQTKLKPLHWDKVIANVDHSTVWDEINNGSFRFDDDMMEALFGYVTNEHKPQERHEKFSNSGKSNPAAMPQVFILEPRKSQNTAIVLKSLAMSRREILEALKDGQGLSVDALEKLTKISPTQEDQTKITNYNGDPSKLAVAESFLYHILKEFPAAFSHFKAMLFRSSYDSEILQLKETLQTLELGCKELRTRGLFLKLLEAILKAGNRMNAGTARGNAQGFNLTALQKLSDVKSTDGKTTLLHFMVEQVARSEGRRVTVNRGRKIEASNQDRLTPEEREKEYLWLGLPALEGLNVELSEVKKAANIEYESFIDTCSNISVGVEELRQIIRCSSQCKGGGFVREMKGFLEECEGELKVVKDEQTRIMDIVKRTTKYYQVDKTASNPLQLFVIVKDFLNMVGHVRKDLSQKLEKKDVGSSPPLSPTMRSPRRFQNSEFHSLWGTSPDQSDDDF